MVTHVGEIVQVRKDLPSGSIILNRGERRNALSQEMLQRIQEAFDDFAQEKKVRAVILTGTGQVFCSGSDLRELHEERDPEQPPAVDDQMMALHQLLETMLRFPKPIICAPNGWVVGSGMALLLACDLVVASDKAHFVLPEPRRGLVAGLAAPLLVHRIGAGRAAGMLFPCATISAEQALAWGLAHHVVEDRLVWFRSQELAKEIAELAAESMQMTKKLVNETICEQLFMHLNIGAANSAAARSTETAQEGVKAFLEHRHPRWG